MRKTIKQPHRQRSESALRHTAFTLTHSSQIFTFLHFTYLCHGLHQRTEGCWHASILKTTADLLETQTFISLSSAREFFVVWEMWLPPFLCFPSCWQWQWPPPSMCIAHPFRLSAPSWQTLVRARGWAPVKRRSLLSGQESGVTDRGWSRFLMTLLKVKFRVHIIQSRVSRNSRQSE